MVQAPPDGGPAIVRRRTVNQRRRRPVTTTPSPPMLSARTRGGRELGALKEVLKRCGQAASRFGLHVLHVWIRLPGPAEQRDHASAPASVRAGGVPYGGRRTGARESPWLSRQAIACRDSQGDSLAPVRRPPYGTPPARTDAGAEAWSRCSAGPGRRIQTCSPNRLAACPHRFSTSFSAPSSRPPRVRALNIGGEGVVVTGRRRGWFTVRRRTMAGPPPVAPAPSCSDASCPSCPAA